MTFWRCRKILYRNTHSYVILALGGDSVRVFLVKPEKFPEYSSAKGVLYVKKASNRI